MISFFVAMTPVGKARARVTSRGTYTPKKTQDAERLIAWEAKKAMESQKPIEGAVRMTIDAYFDHPRSWSRKRVMGAVWKTSKPDADNIAKTVKDALKGVAWLDDAQVAELIVRKQYTSTGKPRLRIEIGELK